MSFFEIYALFVLPVLVAVGGALIAWLYIRHMKKHDRQHPAE